MCNIAGYVGTREAAPILIEMMKRQEGWGGGYYTGLVTMNDGKLERARAIGDTQRMVDTTNAAGLKGTIGLIHSRSQSGGDEHWAHPFIGTGGHLAFVANGGYGCFLKEPYTAERSKIFDSLEKSGYHSETRTLEPVKYYPNAPTASDGSIAHSCDIMAQYITKLIDDGRDASSAMDEAFCTMPFEFVGLTLHTAEPDCIIWSRVNMPMMLGFAEHGVYMASTALAFPDDAKNITMLPTLSGGRVYRDSFTARRYDAPPCTVAQITPRVWHEAYGIIENALKEKPHGLGALAKLITPCFDEADCMQRAMLIYNILHALKCDGRLKVEEVRVNGMLPELDAPLFKGYIE